MINWLKKLFRKKIEPVMVWGILGSEDHQEDGYSMTLRVSYRGKVSDAQFWFEGPEDAAHIIKHFQETIGPLELDMEEYELVR